MKAQYTVPLETESEFKFTGMLNTTYMFWKS